MLDDATLKRIMALVDRDDLAGLEQELSKHSANQISRSGIYSDQYVFMYACQTGTPGAVKVFVDKGVACFSIKYSDNTIFKCAARNEQSASEVLALVVQSLPGADIAELASCDGDPYGEMDGDGDGLTPLDILKARGDNKAIEYLQGVLNAANGPPKISGDTRDVADSQYAVDGWPTPNGIGGARWGGPMAILPNAIPQWVYFHKRHKLGFFPNIVYDGQACYFIAENGTAVCLNINDGSLLWEYVPTDDTVRHQPKSIAHLGDIVVADTLVLDKRSGKLINNLETLAPDVEFLDHQVTRTGNRIVRVIDTDNRLGEFFCIDARGNVEIETLPMAWVHGGNESIWIGYANIEPVQLAAYDPQANERMWSEDVEMGQMGLLNDTLCVAGPTQLSVINVRTGSVITRTNTDLIDYNVACRVAMGPTGIFVLGRDRISAFDFSLNEVWRTMIESRFLASGLYRHIVTAGDWIFTVPTEATEITAYRQSDGEQVWKSRDEFRTWSVHPSEDRMIVASIGGQVQAFACRDS